MVFLWVACLLGQDVRVEPRAEAGAWWIDGAIRFDEKPAVGDRLEVRDDLGWDDPSFRPELGLDLVLDRHTLGLSVAYARFLGTSHFDQPTRWNESLFPPGAPVRWRMEVLDSSLDYRFRVLDGSPLRLEAGISARYWRFHLEAETPSLPIDDDNLGAFIPELDLRGMLALSDGVQGVLGLSGMAFTASGLSARSFAIRAAVEWSISSSLILGISGECALLKLISEDPRQRNEIDLRGVQVAPSLAWNF